MNIANTGGGKADSRPLTRKTWRATARGRVNRHKYSITVDVRSMTVGFIKEKGRGKLFSVLRCKVCQTSKTVPQELRLKFEADETSPSYKKLFMFESAKDRDDFAETFRLVLMAGDKAVQAYDALVDFARSSNEMKTSDPKRTSQTSEADDIAKIPDFFDFLRTFCESLKRRQTRRSVVSDGVLNGLLDVSGGHERFREYDGKSASVSMQGSRSESNQCSLSQSDEMANGEDDEDDDFAGGVIELLQGENILQGNSCDTAFRTDLPGRLNRGRFILTSYRVAYLDNNDTCVSFFTPHTMIKEFLVIDICRMRIETRDFRSLELKLIHDNGPNMLTNIQRFVMNHGHKVFAFFHEYTAPGLNGWDIARGDPLYDYKRTGLLDSHAFRIYCNKEFGLCRSYPKQLIVPKSTSDEQIKKVGEYRSLGRIPAIVWLHPATGATLSRCAQPLAGFFGGRCKEDEQMVQGLTDGVTSLGRQLREAANKSAVENAMIKLVILDARPWQAAMGNSVMGKGTENAGNYTGCTLEFARIDNIHAVRTSLESLMSLCNRAFSNDEDIRLTTSQTWLSELENTQWLQYQSLILSAANRIKLALQKGICVLVHCSDGWDRTSQLICLALLMLDPEYRTIKGFVRLIEQQWCSFGHKFAERCGHYEDSKFQKKQQAPIFVQFLEAVWQILRQHPRAFEFNERFLATIAFHTYSCRFGTFLYNTDMEREKYKVESKTVSLWTYMLCPAHQTKYTNPLYALRTLKKELAHRKRSRRVGSKSIACLGAFGIATAYRTGDSTGRLGPDKDEDVKGIGEGGGTKISLEVEPKANELTVNPNVYALGFWESFHLRWLRGYGHVDELGIKGPFFSTARRRSASKLKNSAGIITAQPLTYSVGGSLRLPSVSSMGTISKGGAPEEGASNRHRRQNSGLLAVSAESEVQTAGSEAAVLYRQLRIFAESKGFDLSDFDEISALAKGGMLDNEGTVASRRTSGSSNRLPRTGSFNIPKSPRWYSVEAVNRQHTPTNKREGGEARIKGGVDEKMQIKIEPAKAAHDSTTKASNTKPEKAYRKS